MALPKELVRREFDKFRESPGNRVAVGTVNAENFEINNVEKISGVIYYGQENIDGIWMVRKISKVTGPTSTITTIEYASIKANPLITTYADAWTNRATLTYGNYAESI